MVHLTYFFVILVTAEVISQAVDIENDIFTFCKDNGFKYVTTFDKGFRSLNAENLGSVGESAA